MMIGVYYPPNIIKIILLLTVALFPCHSLDINCSNYYDIANAPDDCNLITGQCVFQSFVNSSLIVNSTDPEHYGLCLNLHGLSIDILSGEDTLTNGVYIQAQSISLSEGYTFASTSTFVMIADTIFISDSNITSSMVWLEANSVNISETNIISKNDFGVLCSCGSMNQNLCKPPPYYFPFLFDSIQYISNYSFVLMNYTFQNWFFQFEDVDSVVILAQDYVSLTNSTIRVSAQAIYTEQLLVSNSVLNSSGLGYSSGTGPGCGYFDQVLNQLIGCTGTGASHGGYGGNSCPENCNLLISSPPYDFEQLPKYPGSGGGFFLKELQQVSSGGGVINVQVNDLSIQNSVFLANGVGGIQGGGGGSGGAVSIDFSNLDVSGEFNVSANGGGGRSSGGGGRIRFFYHKWNQVSKLIGAQNLKISADGGPDCDGKLTCGQKGSISTAPCPPGYQLDSNSYTCILCPVGTYQLSYGYQDCINCKNKPDNSKYNKVELSQLNNYNKVCNFTCINGSDGGDVYRLYNGKECLNNFDYILAPVGGINLLICLGIIIATLVIFLIIMMIRKISFNDRTFEDLAEHSDFNKKKTYFQIEDIPFHQIRIYLEGANNPNHPWVIPEHVQQRLSCIQQYKQHMPFLTRLFNSLNSISKYSQSVYWSIWVLKIYYYPLGIFLASKLRQKKARKFRSELIRLCKQKFDNSMGIKFHVNLKYTVGCLQLFNYNKETLDYYIKNYFPLYFKLQKLLMGGYGIDFSDPIFKALCYQYEEKSEKGDKLEGYLLELNQLLRNSEQTLSIFKHLWKISNIWPQLQCHLWQPDNIILGVNDKNQIDKQKDLFLVFSTQGKDISCDPNSPTRLNRSLPLSQRGMNEERVTDLKTSKHFLYKCDLPNFFFDQIALIRHKYQLREAMIEVEQKKTIFWQIENNFSQKSLSWILGTINIVNLLLTLLSFFFVIFLIVDGQKVLLYAFVPYFIIFPFSEFLMIFLDFSLLISKGAKVFTFSLYFTIFSAIKMALITIIELAITISHGFDDLILIFLFVVWLLMVIFNVLGLVLLSMLHVHYVKTR